MTLPIVSSTEPVALFGAGVASADEIAVVRDLTGPCVAADGGARTARAHGVELNAVIGDFDSVDTGDLAHIPKARQHRIAEQDSTDFDKALRHISAPLVLAVGFLGGRVDHQLACLHVLARRADRACILVGADEIIFLCPPVLELGTEPGDVVSLFPLGTVRGRSSGLRWPIDGLEFHPLTMIGTSNEATGPISLSVSEPRMIVIAPRHCLQPLTQALVHASQSAPWPARAGQYKDQRQS